MSARELAGHDRPVLETLAAADEGMAARDLAAALDMPARGMGAKLAALQRRHLVLRPLRPAGAWEISQHGRWTLEGR